MNKLDTGSAENFDARTYVGVIGTSGTYEASELNGLRHDGYLQPALVDLRDHAPRIDLADRPPVVERSGRSEVGRRIFDLLVGSLLALALSPVWLSIVVAGTLFARGPILYGQDRVGRNGAIFQCWKFRTMRVDADRALADLLARDPEARRQWHEDRKLTNDPRVTRFGALLRRFDLDELPQLLNVLFGEMSVVGPRPVVPEEITEFGDDLPVVLSVNPGLTGFWQTSGRNLMSYYDRVQTEVEYVRTSSFWGDIKICLRTPLVILRSNSGR